MAWVSRTMISREKEVMKTLYKSLVRPHLEYCVQLWSPNPRFGNWKVILDIEHVQRKFTCLIEGIGTMTYRERLNKLSLTTLLERRVRGDLIETYKIVNGVVNYGQEFFQVTNAKKLIAPINKGKFTQSKADFFSRRVIRYWNKLPFNVKNSPSVNCFKARLEDFKKKSMSNPYNKSNGNFWELSEDIFSRIKDGNRKSHIDYLLNHPFVAKRRGINIH